MKNIKIQQTLNKIKFKTVKNAPTLLIGAGTIGILTAGVLACKSTMKLSGVLEEHKETLETIQELKDANREDYPEEVANRDKAVVYRQTAFKIVKLYTPSVVLAGVSIAAIIQSHNILNRRNAAIAAALTTATETFSKYRKSVVERYGERVDYELRHGIKAEKITTKDEDGKTKKETIDVMNNVLEDYSDYARFYDDGCTGWSKDPEYNLMFLKAQQQYANDKLVAQGYLFLNDVYDMLGIPKSKAGQIVGWIYDPKNPIGDNYVDFGMYDVNKPNARDFVNGYEKTILLDFNVDGNVWEKM